MVLLLVFPIAFALSALFHKKFEETAALAVFVITTVVYVSGLVTTFTPGMICVFALAGISAVYCVIRACRDRSILRELFFTAGFAGFLVLAVYFLAFSLGRYLQEYDDFIHWGICVRNYYLTADFSNVPFSPDMAPSYPPFVPLWSYITTKCWITCSTGMMYWGEHLLLVSLLCQLFEKTEQKPRGFRFWLTVFFVLAVPFFSSSVNHAYGKLSPDILIGFALFFIMFNYRKYLMKDDPYYFFLVLSGLFAVTLIKDPGVIIAAIACFMIGYINIRLELPVRKNLKRLCLCAVPVFAAFSSWHGYLSICETGGLGAIFSKFEDFYLPILLLLGFVIFCLILWAVIGSGGRNRISALYLERRQLAPGCVLAVYILFCVFLIFTIDGNRSELNEFLKNISTFVFDNSMYYLGNVVKLPLILFAVLLYFAVKKYGVPRLSEWDGGKEGYIWDALYYGFVMYFFFRIVSFEQYQMEFRETLHSFDRYIYQFFVVILILAFYHAVSMAAEKKHLVYLLLFILLFTKNSMVFSELFNKSKPENFAGLEGVSFEFGDKVFLMDVYTDEDRFELDFKYQVAPANVNNAYEATWYPANDLDGRRLTVAEVSDRIGSYDYVYLKNLDDGFREYYADLFEQGALIDPEHLYRVEQGAGGQVKLSFVN